MRRTYLGLGMLLAAGCQDPADNTQANCKVYQENYCDKEADCAIEFDDLKKSERDQSVAKCYDKFRSQGLSCGDVKRVSETFDQCTEDLEKWSCTQFYDVSSSRRYVPLSCVNVLQN
ncbi:MAG: hypothetical protein QM778_25495 [Myxococcales bacterium]